jgi:hypothetical protein
MRKGRIFLFHWNQAEAEEYAKGLRDQGWDVNLEWQDGARGSAAVKADPPDAVVFYLTRLASHSRATAEYLAQTKSTRHLPLIFVGGAEVVVAKTKAKIPIGIFVSLDELTEVLQNWFKG